MQLQGSLAEYAAAGITVMAISPDRIADLAAFSAEHAITFPLLSDADASVIRAYGILNTLIDEDEEEFGIPYPGSYLVGRDGRVEQKSFHREYQLRETALTALHTGFGVDPHDADVSADGAPAAKADAPGVRIRATLGALHMSFKNHADLYVSLELDEGLHVYADPVPDGYQPVEVRVSGPEGVRIGETVLPATRPMRIAGLDEEFDVIEERAVIRVPLILDVRPSEELTEATLRIEVRYQACTDRLCLAPGRTELELTVPLRD